MPSDITGTELLEEDHGTGKREFTFVKGPVFAQVVLADEINRAPPKTQAALLQAMQEHDVTVAGKTYSLPNDTMRNAEYEKFAALFIKKGITQNREKATYIQNFELKDLGVFKK
jgi:hypothetical protein